MENEQRQNKQSVRIDMCFCLRHPTLPTPPCVTYPLPTTPRICHSEIAIDRYYFFTPNPYPSPNALQNRSTHITGEPVT